MPSVEELANKAIELAGIALHELDQFAGAASDRDANEAFSYVHHVDDDKKSDAPDTRTWQTHAALNLLVGLSSIRSDQALQRLGHGE
jgi:hypothetical protein